MILKTWRLASRYYASTVVVIWAAMFVYFYGPYYRSFLASNTRYVLVAMGLTYTLAAPAFYWVQVRKGQKIAPTRSYLALCSLKKLLRSYGSYLQKLTSKSFYPNPKITAQERTNLLFMIVKFFFLPLMLNFLFANISGINNGVDKINAYSGGLSLASFNSIFYPFILSALLLIDTAYFTFGYAVESKLLNNKVVSVDPTFLGWFSALICYPPFNGYVGNYLSWRANDFVAFHSSVLTSLLYLAVLALMAVYVAASVALGAKASNLTNRGIVNRWPYSFVRHPAYISKNMAWWLTLIPVMTPAGVLTMACWSFIYFLRSVTEERHLMMMDNGYKQYAGSVRWRFIPGVY